LNSFYSKSQLKQIGFESIGENVLISCFARFYMPENISIGNNVRIDDFCLLSGNIEIGSNVHISAYCALYGKFGIEIQDYSGISPRCTIFSASDDFSGDYFIGPMVNCKLTNITGGKVIIKKYSQIGANCLIMPNVIIHEGVAVGAMSLVLNELDSWSIYTGIPAKLMKERSKNA
jgi:acetyltransferase-like isoleucine patch superfamily enzyme